MRERVYVQFVNRLQRIGTDSFTDLASYYGTAHIRISMQHEHCHTGDRVEYAWKLSD